MSVIAYSRLVDALEAHGCEGNGRGLHHCPVHEDRTPSLSISDLDDRALIHCHAGCDTIDVLDRLGLGWGDLYDERAAGKGWTTTALRKVGARADGDGRVTLGGVRYLPGGDPKSLAVKGSKRDLWPDPATVDGTVLFVVEGEPDAVTATQLGLPAVAIPGTGKFDPSWAARIAEGRDRVVFIPDADAPGRKAAKKWAAAIAERCTDVRVLDLEPDRDDGYDLSDHAADAVTDADWAELRRAIVGAAERVRPFAIGGVAIHPDPLGGGKLAPPRDLALQGAAEGCQPVGKVDGNPLLRVLDVDRMLTTEPPPVPWAVEPMLAEGCVTMLAGREGQGKSMLALALASAIGHGATVAGLACREGRVLYVDAENGEREAHRRVRGLGVKRGMLTYVEANGFSLAQDMGLLAALVDEYRPAVLVLDSLRSLAPGLDENDSRPVEASLRPVSRLAQDKGIPVLLLHHAGKQGTEYRGSTAIGAAVEIGFTLSRREEDPEKRTRRRVVCWKSRPAPEPEPRWITLEARDGTIYIGEAEAFEGDGRPRDALREQVLGILTGIAQSQSRIAVAVGRARTDGTIRRVLQDLNDEGLVEKRDDGWARVIEGVLS